jgi:hypothetical protein
MELLSGWEEMVNHVRGKGAIQAGAEDAWRQGGAWADQTTARIEGLAEAINEKARKVRRGSKEPARSAARESQAKLEDSH